MGGRHVTIDASDTFDVAVVGSGFGGSVVAARLAQAGRKVLLLERGQAWPPGSFPRTPYAFKNVGFWDPTPPHPLHGLFDVRSFSGIDAVVASGLGGGSLIYANVMLRKDADTFVREPDQEGSEDWPLTREDLDPHYDRFLARQRPQQYPFDHEPYSATAKTLALREAGQKMELDVEFPPLAVMFANEGHPPRPGEVLLEDKPNLHNASRSTCRLCGECDVGCNYGAKQTLDYTFISDAKDAGAEIRTCCEARTITPLPRGGYELAYTQHLGVRALNGEHLVDPVAEPERVVMADRVVLGAGTFGTVKLLLANRVALPRISRRLGDRFSCNGDLIMVVRNCHKDGQRRQIHPSYGPVITATLRVPGVDRAGRDQIIQDAGHPTFLDWFLHSLEVPEDLMNMTGTMMRRVGQSFAHRRDTSISAELSELLGTTRSSADMMPLLGVGRDRPTGKLLLRGDMLDLDWDPDDHAPYFDALDETCKRISEHLGGTVLPKALRRMARLITVHPLGGACMADSAERGVIDPKAGEVFGHPGLHVCDGAAMPGSVGVNPGLTIAAFADRVADAIIAARPMARPL
jgi:cholesterol oxidase